MSAGLSLDKALLIVAQASSRRLRMALDCVRSDILSGHSLSKSFLQHLKISKTYVGLIGHGESSGELLRALSISRVMMEKQQDALRKCTSALVYPCVIGVFAAVLTIGLVRGVMPQITPMLRSLHVDLPLLTRIVISISENMTQYGLYVCGGLVLFMTAFIVLYLRIGWFRYITQAIIARLPIVGRVIFLYSLSIFLQSLGSLVESGAPVPQSFNNTMRTISFLPLQKVISAQLPNIQKGISCGLIFSNLSKRIPPYVPSLLLAGESSGQLGTSLLRAAAIIDRDMDHGLKRMTSLIEPLMMVGMGCTVGSIALSIMMPIYDISKALQH